MSKHTPGPWILATSNSWRRFLSRDGTPVCEPITQRDGHPDLHFRNGGADGPDARLIAAAPDLLAALLEISAMTDEDNGTFRKRGGTYRGLVSIIAGDALAKVGA